ncbi:MAG TPA: hypothetical protein V6D29_09440 [Leptolyngbyaceae cyanobacterium]
MKLIQLFQQANPRIQQAMLLNCWMALGALVRHFFPLAGLSILAIGAIAAWTMASRLLASTKP